VTVDTKVGEGTVFNVYLPVAESDDAADPAPLDSGGVVGAKGERVLLVEDEDSVRRVAAKILEGLGYEVVEAASGPDALAMTNHNADVLVTDVVMPGGVSGRDLVEQLRSDWPGLKVLYMSGYSADLLRGDGERTYPHFLQKPFTRDSLARAVRDCLDADVEPGV
jgi:CheY-like chemotaxis protein